MSLEIQPARYSKQSLLPAKFILIDEELIGTHENIDVKKLKNVLKNILEQGYKGPAISVFQSSSDEIYNSLNPLADPGTIESTHYGQLGITDGHSRLTALRILSTLNLLKSSVVPFQIVPARLPNIVRIGTLSQYEKPISIEEIEACFSDKNKVISSSTSHFQVKLNNGTWVRLREGQPDIIIPLKDFINLDEYQKIEDKPEILEKAIQSCGCSQGK